MEKKTALTLLGVVLVAFVIGLLVRNVFVGEVIYDTSFSGSGYGSLDDPLQIANCTQLQEMENDLDAYYILVNDIDCSDTINWWDGPGQTGYGFDPVGDDTDWPNNLFSGGFDGDDYVISDLYIDRPSEEYVGLFGIISDADIIDVGLEDVDINGNQYTGGLVGHTGDDIGSGTINNVYTTGSVSGGWSTGGAVGSLGGSYDVLNSYSTATILGSSGGGLIGYIDYGSSIIENCYATGDVNGTEAVGGLAGYCGAFSRINNCSATGTVTGTGSRAGGLTAYVDGGLINNSYATGNVSGNNQVGGLIASGCCGGSIRNSYATGNVTGIGDYAGGLISNTGAGGPAIINSYATGAVSTGGNYVGGIVGSIDSDVDNSYATGDVDGGEYTGGLIGMSYSDIDNSYATGEVTGDSNVGGLVGSNYNDVNNCYYLYQTGYGLGLDCIGTINGGSVDCTAETEESYFFDIQNEPMAEDLGYGYLFRWDFENIWDDIYDDVDYPPLRFQGLTLEEEEEEGAPSGGGGGDAPETIKVSFDEIEDGVLEGLEKGDTLEFEVYNPDTESRESHSARVVSIDYINKIVTIEISSNPITVTLGLGQSKEVDVNGDGINDVFVEFVSIVGRKANIFFKELVPSVEEGEEVISPVVDDEEEERQEPAIETEKSSPILNYLVYLILIVFVIFIFIVLATKKKKVKKEVIKKLSPEELKARKRAAKKAAESRALAQRREARLKTEKRKAREARQRSELRKKSMIRAKRQRAIESKERKIQEFKREALRK